ncbi:hypothetical protein L2E82_39519 [Cichorium intybus]|uniref:Uncharacterized protein n=1 Tax=Cichorium intybus TaxID=13427 RepID=A0ACB9AIT6_CICIN|nr:hypothetical protein L2E82_39519 [Cichorium intybus]
MSPQVSLSFSDIESIRKYLLDDHSENAVHDYQIPDVLWSFNDDDFTFFENNGGSSINIDQEAWSSSNLGAIYNPSPSLSSIDSFSMADLIEQSTTVDDLGKLDDIFPVTNVDFSDFTYPETGELLDNLLDISGMSSLAAEGGTNMPINWDFSNGETVELVDSGKDTQAPALCLKKSISNDSEQNQASSQPEIMARSSILMDYGA